MSASLESHASDIGNSVGNGLGMDPLTIITIVSTLLPMLAKCFGQAPQSAHDYLQDHFDANTNTFDARLVEKCRPRTRRAARKNGQRRLTPQQLDQITIASLNHAIEQDPNVLASAIVDAANLPGDDE